MEEREQTEREATLTHNVLLCLQAIREDAQELEERVILEYQPLAVRIADNANLAIGMLIGTEEEK